MTIDITKLNFGGHFYIKRKLLSALMRVMRKSCASRTRTRLLLFFFYLCESDHLILFASPALPSRVQSSFICTGNDDTPKEQRKSHCAGEIKKRNFEKKKNLSPQTKQRKKQRDKQKSTELANRL